MPSPPHETMVMLLRERPEWLRTLLATVAGRTLPSELAPMDAAVRVVDPAEVRPDLLFAGPRGGAWVAVEVQLAVDPAKARRWPLTVAALWNERGIVGDLVVLTADRSVAAWARSVGRMRGPLGTALGARPGVVPLTAAVAHRLLDEAHPELAFFAAWTVHHRWGREARAVVLRAVEVVDALPDPVLRGTLVRHIMAMLHERLLAKLREATMDLQKIPATAAFLRWEAEVEARGEARMLLRVLQRRGLVVDAAARARIEGCGDLATLERWADAALGASSVEELWGG